MSGKQAPGTKIGISFDEMELWDTISTLKFLENPFFSKFRQTEPVSLVFFLLQELLISTPAMILLVDH